MVRSRRVAQLAHQPAQFLERALEPALDGQDGAGASLVPVGAVLQRDDLGAEREVFGEEAGGLEFEGADAEGLRRVCSAGGLVFLLLHEVGFLWAEVRGGERRTLSVLGSGARSGV